MPIVHPFVSPLSDNGDPNEVGPSEWNAAHTLPTVDELSTVEDDTDKRLAPDGTGGVEWVAGGGGVSSHDDLTDVSADDHHAQQHSINGADHTGTLDDAQIPASIARDTEVTAAVASHVTSEHSGLATDAEVTAAIATHAGLADPHAGYRLESADHSHQSTGAQAGQLDHGAALTGLTDDDHTQYLKEKAAGGLASEVPEHDHTEAAQGGRASFYGQLRLASTNSNSAGTIAVNSTSYQAPSNFRFYWDGVFQPFTHFRIYLRGLVTEASPATVSLQLATSAAAGTPLSASGNDTVVNSNVNATYDSGWVACVTPMATAQELVVGTKGSNGTVDLQVFVMDIQLKYDP